MLEVIAGIKIADYEGKPVIAVGGGKVVMPGKDIGAGHITPAKAILEALQQHPDVRAGKVLVQPILPENGQLPGGIKFPNRDVTISAGFSGLPEDTYRLTDSDDIYTPTLSKAKPTGKFIQFVPDTQPKVGLGDVPGLLWAGVRHPSTAFNAVKRYFDPNTVRFGRGATSPWSQFGSYNKISPALTDEALTGIRQVVQGKLTAARVYMDFAKSLEEQGNTEGASYIRQGIMQARKAKQPYKPILITGSSRGDYVAQKSRDIMEALKKHNLTGYSVVPLLGKNVNVTGQLLKDTGLPLIGGAPQRLYNRLRGTAALNIGSSGASDLNELKALPAPSVIPRLQNALRDREISQLKGLDEPAMTKLRNINTELWNAGGLQDIERTKPHGISLYNDPEEIVKKLQDPRFMDFKKNLLRARKYLLAAEEGKVDLADRLVSEAYRSVKEK